MDLLFLVLFQRIEAWLQPQAGRFRQRHPAVVRGRRPISLTTRRLSASRQTQKASYTIARLSQQRLAQVVHPYRLPEQRQALLRCYASSASRVKTKKIVSLYVSLGLFGSIVKRQGEATTRLPVPDNHGTWGLVISFPCEAPSDLSRWRATPRPRPPAAA